MTIKDVVQNFGKWFFRLQPTQVTRYPLDEELIKKDQIIKAQAQQLQGRDAQLAKQSAERNERREKEKSQDYSEQLAIRAREREEEIKGKRFRHTFSWRHLFNKMGYETKPTKFAKKVEVTDKDDTVVFGNFGDLITIDNGVNIITDTEGNILNRAKDMTQLIWKPDGMENYMKRNRIPLALDEDMNRVPDLEEEEHSDVYYDQEKIDVGEDGKPLYKDEEGNVIKGGYRETEMRRRPVKEMLIEKQERINEVENLLERAEKIIIDKDHRLQAQNRVVRTLQNRTDLKDATLSEVMDKAMQFESKVGGMQNMINKLTELKAMHETELNQLKTRNEDIMKKIEDYGSKTLSQKIKEEIRDDIEFFSDVLPEKTVQLTEQVAVEEKEAAQPGRKMK